MPNAHWMNKNMLNTELITHTQKKAEKSMKGTSLEQKNDLRKDAENKQTHTPRLFEKMSILHL